MLLFLTGEMIAEYKGERIDIYECDAREVIYNRDKIPNYFFAITGTKIIVDATKHGNDSKFINHSCDVNILNNIQSSHSDYFLQNSRTLKWKLRKLMAKSFSYSTQNEQSKRTKN